MKYLYKMRLQSTQSIEKYRVHEIQKIQVFNINFNYGNYIKISLSGLNIPFYNHNNFSGVCLSRVSLSGVCLSGSCLSGV